MTITKENITKSQKDYSYLWEILMSVHPQLSKKQIYSVIQVISEHGICGYCLDGPRGCYCACDE